MPRKVDNEMKTENKENNKNAGNVTANVNKDIKVEPKTPKVKTTKVEKIDKPIEKKTEPPVEKTITKRHVKSAKKRDAGKQRAKDMKERGLGLFASKKLSPALSAVVSSDTLCRTEVVRRVWAYIKENQLNRGRLIYPDEKLRSVFSPSECGEYFDMLRMSSFLTKHFVQEYDNINPSNSINKETVAAPVTVKNPVPTNAPTPAPKRVRGH